MINKEIPTQARFGIEDNVFTTEISPTSVVKDGRTIEDVKKDEKKWLIEFYEKMSRIANWPPDHIPDADEILILAIMGFLANEDRKLGGPDYDPRDLFRGHFSSKVKI